MNPRPDKLIPALYGGIIMALISSIPFLSLINCLCCAGVMLGGFLAVFFYKDNFTQDTPPFTSGDCMAVGALSGVFGAILGTMLSIFFVKLFGNVMGQFIVEMFHNLNVDLPSEAWQAMEESLNSPLTLFAAMLQLFGSLAIDAIFGLLGGLIGYSIYKPKGRVMPSPPMPPPAA